MAEEEASSVPCRRQFRFAWNAPSKAQLAESRLPFPFFVVSFSASTQHTKGKLHFLFFARNRAHRAQHAEVVSFITMDLPILFFVVRLSFLFFPYNSIIISTSSYSHSLAWSVRFDRFLTYPNHCPNHSPQVGYYGNWKHPTTRTNPDFPVWFGSGWSVSRVNLDSWPPLFFTRILLWVVVE